MAKALMSLPASARDRLAQAIFAAFGIGPEQVKQLKTESAIDAQRAAAPKPDKFQAGGQTEAFSKSGQIRDYRNPATSANKAPTTSPTPSGPKPQATPPRVARDTAPAGQLNTQGVPKPANPGSAAQLGASRARLLPGAGQSGGSQPPKGTKQPVRGGSNLSPADARRSNAASKAAGANVRPSATSSSSTPMPGGKPPRGASLAKSLRPGRSTLLGLGLGLANYLQDAILTDEQLRVKAENEIGTPSIEEDFGAIGMPKQLERILTNLGKSREERLNPQPSQPPAGFGVKGSLLSDQQSQPAAPQSGYMSPTKVLPPLPPRNPNAQAPVTASPSSRIIPYPNLGTEQVTPMR